MKPAPVQKSSFLVTLRSSFRSLFSNRIAVYTGRSVESHADASGQHPDIHRGDSCTAVILFSLFFCIDLSSFAQDSLLAPKTRTYSTGIHLTPEQIKKRTKLVIAGNIVGYGSAMIGLYSAWYKDYPQTKFHSFNDWHEWKQVDKVGHLYSAYVESRGSMELWRWTGIDRKKRIWIGGMSGAFYQTVIETLDGFSAQWGWSWADFGTNILGSGMLVAQELAWNDQRIKLKFSFHKKNYGDHQLQQRTESLFGRSDAERFLKDYNGQTYWASANIRSFFPKSNIPPWLEVSLGYGAEGLFGGTDNTAKDENGNITFDRRDITRRRQWYIGPDIDLSKIRTHSKPLKLFLTFLSAFKFPAPALEFNTHGKAKFYFLYF